MRVLAAHQPNYMPHAAFFAKMSRADVFVLLHRLKMPKNSYGPRCQIMTAEGPKWLTIPIPKDQQGKLHYGEIVLEDAEWRGKHLARIRQAYAKAPSFHRVYDIVRRNLCNMGTFRDINTSLIYDFQRLIGIDNRVLLQAPEPPAWSASERLASLTQRYGCKVYLSGPGGRAYLDEAVFRARGVAVEYLDHAQPFYPQQHTSDFVEGLSVLDLLMNVDASSARGAIG